MATVPYRDGVPRVAPASEAPDVYQRLRPGSGFLAQGAAMQDLGGSLEKVAKTTMAMSDYYDDVAADDGLNTFQERTRNILYGDPNRQVPGPGGQMQPDTGYLSMQGQDALRARADVTRQIDDLDKEISANLKSPKAQAAYAKASRNYRNSLLTKVSGHADAEAKNWYMAVNTSTGVNALTDIAVNADDPQAVAKYTDDLIGARVKNLQLAGNAGDPNLLKATIDGAKADALVAQVKAMAVKEPAKALELLDANKATAGVQYDELSNAVRARAEQQIGLGVAQKVIDQVATKPVASPPAAAPGQAPAAPGEKPDAAKVAAAIHAQESGGAATAATSSAGAVGGWQIMPATFAKYAKEGEKIDNPADNAAVGQRIVDDLYAKAGGDPARVAVGYFSGEGNIAAPGSATPWVNDVKDATGKSVSSYVNDVVGRLGGAPAAPAQPQDAATGIASMKADAFQTILDDKSLTPGARSAALSAVGQHYQMLDARRIDEERQAAARKRDIDAASDKTENEVIKNLTGDKPSVTAQQIGADPTLKPEAKLRMLAFSERTAKAEPLARVSHETLLTVMDRMNRPEGDPLRIDRADQITDIFNDGTMTKADYNFAIKQFNNAQSAEGQVLTKQKADFLTGVGPLIDKSNPLMGTIDQSGKQQLYRFQWFVAEQIDRYRQEGKNPWDLLNPGKPDYLGKPETLAPFQKSIQESIQDQAKALTDGAAKSAPAAPKQTVLQGAPMPNLLGLDEDESLPAPKSDLPAPPVQKWGRDAQGNPVRVQ